MRRKEQAARSWACNRANSSDKLLTWRFTDPHCFRIIAFFEAILYRLGPENMQFGNSWRRHRYAPPAWHPSSPRSPADPNVTQQKNPWCTPFTWRKQGKRVYTTCPEERYAPQRPQTQQKAVRRVFAVVVRTSFFPELRETGVATPQMSYR